jgi:protocatechuate 3,4-dioxygenase alpha subunit
VYRLGVPAPRREPAQGFQRWSYVVALTPVASPVFPGWGRCATDARGGFAFTTLAPDPAAPYLAVAILARGLVKPLWTRVYLADTGDALLAGLPPERRATLLAQPEAGGWRWDVRLQGDGETVFLAL